jgi:NADH-quinone oxidoreductase subunit J
MTMVQLIFYAFSAVAIFSGMMVVASANTVRGALFLVLTFFAMAGIWILLHAEFLALILVLVYVGAVMTLFLFVVMMLSVNRVSKREGFVRYFPVALLIVLMVMGIALLKLGPAHFGLAIIPQPAPEAANFSNTASLGDVLYTHYVYPFEIAAVLLLTAIVAAISLTHEPRKRRASQNITRQHEADPKNRLRMVSMPSATKISPVRKPVLAPAPAPVPPPAPKGA